MASGFNDSVQTEVLLNSDKDDRFFNVLVTGKTGVGKSRLVNTLVGGNVTNESTYQPTAYSTSINDVAVKVWDSPGLQDGTGNEDQYIKNMKGKIKDVALMIYCVRMDEARFYDADKNTIQILTDEFGKEVWNHAVVGLTFANKVEHPDGEDEVQYFKHQLGEWERQFQEYLVSLGVDVEIPVIPVGNKAKSMDLPDRENWLSDLWIECYCVMKASGRRGMYRINRHRLRPSSDRRSLPVPNGEDDSPDEICLNEQQEKAFLKRTWEAFLESIGKKVAFVKEKLRAIFFK